MEKTNFSQMDTNVLHDEVKSMQQELLNLRLNASSGQTKDSSQFKKLRVRIARALTNLSARERANLE